MGHTHLPYHNEKDKDQRRGQCPLPGWAKGHTVLTLELGLVAELVFPSGKLGGDVTPYRGTMCAKEVSHPCSVPGRKKQHRGVGLGGSNAEQTSKLVGCGTLPVRAELKLDLEALGSRECNSTK